MFRYQADNNILQHKYINYHVRLKQPIKPLAVADRDCKTCKASQNCSLISEDFFHINIHFQPNRHWGSLLPLCFKYMLSWFSLSIVSNLSPLILLSTSRSASHSHFPHFMYFLLWSFTDTRQQNLLTNLLADIDLFQEYVRLRTRNLNKMKKKCRFPGRC